MKITLQRTSPNYRQKLSTQRIMRDLTIGLLVIVAYSLFYQFTSQNTTDYVVKAALIYLVSLGVAFATEIVWALIHKDNIVDHLKGSFPWVTAIIFALTLPIGTPLYVTAIGSFIAIFFGKLVYGGFGFNIFNPALVGRVVVHLAFGGQLTTTLSNGVDAVASATPAAALAATKWMGEGFSYELMDLFLGNHGGTLGETCIWLILLVGVVLAFRRVFDARIPVAYLGTVLILSEVFALMNGLDPLTYPLVHLCIGGVVFGAVIMATDPVTSPTSPLGKILFGIGLGFLTMIIRLKANFPEGVLFSILMMNMLTPWIDSLVLGRTNKNIAKQWASIGLSLLLAIGCVVGAGYSIQNEIAIEKQKAEEAAKKAEEAAKKKAEEEANAFNWKLVSKSGNTYVMETEGYMKDQNKLKTEITINGDKVKVKVLEFAGETEYYGKDMIEGITSGKMQEFHDKFLAKEFTRADVEGVDTATGATMTTKGVLNAIKGAIAVSQMEIDGNTYTVTTDGYMKDDNKLKVQVTVNGDKVKVKVLEFAGETEYYGKDMIEGIASGKMQEFHDKFLANEFAASDIDGVDTATGATMTTKGIVSAIRQAIAASK